MLPSWASVVVWRMRGMWIGLTQLPPQPRCCHHAAGETNLWKLASNHHQPSQQCNTLFNFSLNIVHFGDVQDFVYFVDINVSADVSGEKGRRAESFITPISGELCCCSPPSGPHKTPPARLVSNFPHSNLSKISDEILLISQIGGLQTVSCLLALIQDVRGRKPEKRVGLLSYISWEFSSVKSFWMLSKSTTYREEEM